MEAGLPDAAVTALWPQLAWAAGLILLTAVLHLLGLFGLIRLLRAHRRLVRDLPELWDALLTPLVLVLGLFALHAAEIGLWAAAYLHIGLVKRLEEALYVSTAVYATLGEGSVSQVASWRLLVAVEGVNGFLLLGWSTAFLVAVVGALREDQAPLSERVHPDHGRGDDAQDDDDA